MTWRARAVKRLSTVERDHRGPGGAHRLDWFAAVVAGSRQHFLDKPVDQRPTWVERYGIPTSIHKGSE